MTKLNIALRHFFNRHPDLRNSTAQGLVNRRALAKRIRKEEALQQHALDAIITALRRFEFEQLPQRPQLDFSMLKVRTKDHLAILELEKTEYNLQRLEKVFTAVKPYQDQTLKVVIGLTIKLFLDDVNVNKVKELFSGKIREQRAIAELVLHLSDEAGKTPGIIAYIAAEFATEGINFVEVLTSAPEILLYVDVKDLLKAYETVQRLKESA